jgi:hypothetical protein
MMNIVRAAMYLGVLACSSSFAADLYRCDWADGRTVYQAAQCGMGAQQTAIDPKNAKREQFRKSQEQERLQKRQKSEAKTSS